MISYMFAGRQYIALATICNIVVTLVTAETPNELNQQSV